MVWGGAKHMKQTFVYITDTVEFLHQYKDAPDEVAYLRNLHRHLAHYKVAIEVFHTDREIEFIMLKHQLYQFTHNTDHDLNCSCEQFAESLLEWAQFYYGKNRDIIIEVSEDGENGVELIYRKEN